MIPQFTQIQLRVLKDRRVSPRMRDVMGLLQSMMNEQGVCWPSFNYIADSLGISRRTVINIINRLVELNYVIKMKRTIEGTNEQTSNYYAINNNYDAGLPLRKKRGEKQAHKPVDKSDFGVKKISPPPSEKNFTPNQVDIFLTKCARTRESAPARIRENGALQVGFNCFDQLVWREVGNVLEEKGFSLQGLKIEKKKDKHYVIRPFEIKNEAAREIITAANLALQEMKGRKIGKITIPPEITLQEAI